VPTFGREEGSKEQTCFGLFFRSRSRVQRGKKRRGERGESAAGNFCMRLDEIVGGGTDAPQGEKSKASDAARCALGFPKKEGGGKSGKEAPAFNRQDRFGEKTGDGLKIHRLGGEGKERPKGAFYLRRRRVRAGSAKAKEGEKEKAARGLPYHFYGGQPQKREEERGKCGQRRPYPSFSRNNKLGHWLTRHKDAEHSPSTATGGKKREDRLPMASRSGSVGILSASMASERSGGPRILSLAISKRRKKRGEKPFFSLSKERF